MAAKLAGLRVGTYVRISDDTDGDAEGVGRQEKDTARFTTERGGTVTKVYAENDTSAYAKRRVQRTDEHGRTFHAYRVLRPVYQQMLSDLRNGAIDAAVVYDIDRLARDPRDLEDAIEVVEHYRRPILGTTGGLDLLSDSGKAMARVMVAMANKASADTARRVRRKHQDNAERGIPVGGRRPFGWQDDKRTLHAEEVALVREAAERVLAGAPLSAIVTDWNSRGIRTTRGNAWTPKALGGVLRNPRVCGYSARNLEQPDGRTVLTVIRDSDGNPVQGVWEPILTVGEWEALCAALAPRTRRPGGNVHRYLLSGLLACGKCGQPMRGLPRQRAGGTTYAYQCHSRSLGGCGGVSILGPQADELLTEALFRRDEKERPRAALVANWDRGDELAHVAQLVKDATAAWRGGVLPSEDYFPQVRELRDEERALRAERAAVVAEQASSAAAASRDLRAEWDGYTLMQKRAALSRLLEAVVVKPLARTEAEREHESHERGEDVPTRRGLPDRLSPVWRKPSA
jgi:site-specific DNA recombinase